MKRSLLAFVIPLCLLFLSGHGQPMAQEQALQATTQLSGSLIFALSQPDHGFIAAQDSSGKGRHLKKSVSETEVEEEVHESTSSKKYVARSYSFATFFYGHLPQYLFNHIKSSFTFCKQRICYYPPYRSLYLVFGVIRI